MQSNGTRPTKDRLQVVKYITRKNLFEAITYNMIQYKNQLKYKNSNVSIYYSSSQQYALLVPGPIQTDKLTLRGHYNLRYNNHHERIRTQLRMSSWLKNTNKMQQVIEPTLLGASLVKAKIACILCMYNCICCQGTAATDPKDLGML